MHAPVNSKAMLATAQLMVGSPMADRAARQRDTLTVQIEGWAWPKNELKCHRRRRRRRRRRRCIIHSYSLI
jgi:hypothetical protein